MIFYPDTSKGSCENNVFPPCKPSRFKEFIFIFLLTGWVKFTNVNNIYFKQLESDMKDEYDHLKDIQFRVAQNAPWSDLHIVVSDTESTADIRAIIVDILDILYQLYHVRLIRAIHQ